MDSRQDLTRYLPIRARRAAAAACAASLSLCLGSAGAEEVNETIRTAGDIGQYAAPVAGIAVALAHHDGEGLRQLALASASTLALVHILKPTIDRQRPNGGGRSFPSGHTAIAFAGAGFLHLRYGWAYGVPAYAVGAFVGFSRVHSDEHWTSDVLAAGAIGIASNLVFTRRYQGVSVSPTAGAGQPGLSFTVTW